MRKRWIQWLGIVWLSLAGVSIQGEEPVDPASLWVGVYSWIQIADRLAESDHWPLALGSYLEARRQIEALSTAHPHFEPEMIAYRRERLAQTITATEERLTDDEHETLMKYLDFIESYHTGETQRFDNQLEAARGSLEMAKSLLEEIIDKKPDSFRAAVAPQLERLDSTLEWIDVQLNWRRPRPVSSYGSYDASIDRGTTRFIKPEDLPKSPGLALSSGLFPGGEVPSGDSAGTAAPEKTTGEKEDAKATSPENGTTAHRFRMSRDSRPGKNEAPGVGKEAAVP